MKKLLSLFFIGIYNLTLAQGGKTITGKIKVADATVDEIIVLNLSTEKETKTDREGNFEIQAQVDDLLIFYAPHLDKMRRLIDEEIYNSGTLTINMTSKIIELDEVTVVDYSHINAFSLGITSTYIKPLSPAERGKYSSELRAKEFEEKRLMIEKLEALYDDDFLINDLKIDKDLTKAFLFYTVEHPWFINILKGKNKGLKTFYLIILGQRYNDLQKKH